jgi:hypothetical protein
VVLKARARPKRRRPPPVLPSGRSVPALPTTATSSGISFCARSMPRAARAVSASTTPLRGWPCSSMASKE